MPCHLARIAARPVGANDKGDHAETIAVRASFGKWVGRERSGHGCSERQSARPSSPDIRRPKTETRKKSEFRKPNQLPPSAGWPPIHLSPCRVSGFGLLSGFGFRPSDLRPPNPSLREHSAVCPHSARRTPQPGQAAPQAGGASCFETRAAT